MSVSLAPNETFRGRFALERREEARVQQPAYDRKSTSSGSLSEGFLSPCSFDSVWGLLFRNVARSAETSISESVQPAEGAEGAEALVAQGRLPATPPALGKKPPCEIPLRSSSSDPLTLLPCPALSLYRNICMHVRLSSIHISFYRSLYLSMIIRLSQARNLRPGAEPWIMTPFRRLAAKSR